MTQNIRRQDGFTLVEILIAVTMFSGMIFIVGAFIRSNANLESFVDEKLEVRQDILPTFQAMVAEIRSMGFSGLGTYPIVEASTSSLIFYSDIDSDGITERLRYFFSTSTINRGVIKATGMPLSYVSSTEIVASVFEKVIATSTPIFQYFGPDFEGNIPPLSQPISIPDVRVIRVLVYADISPRAPRPIEFTRTITVRNLRSN